MSNSTLRELKGTFQGYAIRLVDSKFYYCGDDGRIPLFSPISAGGFVNVYKERRNAFATRRKLFYRYGARTSVVALYKAEYVKCHEPRERFVIYLGRQTYYGASMGNEKSSNGSCVLRR